MQQMANFVVTMSGWTPQMYWDMTMEDRDAIVKEHNRLADESKK